MTSKQGVQFDKVVTGLLGLPGPINPTCGQILVHIVVFLLGGISLLG
jgi:hypothetical protein